VTRAIVREEFVEYFNEYFAVIHERHFSISDSEIQG